MHFKSLSSILLLSIFSLFLIQCKSSKETIQSSNDRYESLEKALLWKIEGKELKEPSYLYGTIHIIGSDDYFLPKGTLSAFDASTKVMFEIDMNEMSDMSQMMSLLNKAFMQDNVTLKDLLSQEEYALVESHFNDMGLPLMFLERIKPMFLSVFAYGDVDPGGLNSGSMKSYEMEFFEMANNSGKPVAGLETIDFQISVFDSIPYEDQAQILVETIKSSNSGTDEFEVMKTMYKDQDIDAMIMAIGEEDPNLSKHEDILVGKRNRNWIPIMSKEMETQPTFFAVGAGHLAGKNGVIHLLRQAGYTLTPLSQDIQ